MNRTMPLWLFAAAALLPPAALIAGLIWGGALAWAGLLTITLFAALMDRAAHLFMGNAPQDAEFPAEAGLLIVLGVAHILLLPVIVAHLSGAAPLADKVGLFLGASLWLGQISNPAAHELIHRPQRALFALGSVMFSMILFGHHTSAHRLVHHKHVASPLDPNTARSGEGFYRFFLRAWVGSFRAGWQAENALRAGKSSISKGQTYRPHPYASYLVLSGASLALAFALGGASGVGLWAMLALSATAQLLLSDYVQHYGLLRAQRQNGRYEPVQDRHSWNAPQWYSSAMMVNAPRHSDHHSYPSRAYPALRLPAAGDAPRLPWPLPLACTIALFPPIWKRAIRPHLKPWLAP